MHIKYIAILCVFSIFGIFCILHFIVTFVLDQVSRFPATKKKFLLQAMIPYQTILSPKSCHQSCSRQWCCSPLRHSTLPILCVNLVGVHPPCSNVYAKYVEYVQYYCFDIFCIYITAFGVNMMFWCQSLRISRVFLIIFGRIQSSPPKFEPLI